MKLFRLKKKSPKSLSNRIFNTLTKNSGESNAFFRSQPIHKKGKESSEIKEEEPVMTQVEEEENEEPVQSAEKEDDREDTVHKKPDEEGIEKETEPKD